jgi:integrase/recombinase XerD
MWRVTVVQNQFRFLLSQGSAQIPVEWHLMNDRKLGPSSLIVTAAALRFLYKVTLHRGWNVEDRIPVPKRPQKLPMVLSPKEVLRFLDSVSSLKYRTILTTCYAAGLRVSEVIRLKPTDIDSQRKVIRIEHGTEGAESLGVCRGER